MEEILEREYIRHRELGNQNDTPDDVDEIEENASEKENSRVTCLQDSKKDKSDTEQLMPETDSLLNSHQSNRCKALEKAEMVARQAFGECSPGRALDRMEEIARQIWKTVPEVSREKAEDVAHCVWETLSSNKAEEMALHAWEAVPGRALDKAEEIARHLWENVPELSLDKAEEIAHRAWAAVPGRALDKAEEIAHRAWEAGWTVMHHHHLPKWLKDNDFLVRGHRPQLNSYWACFMSIFRIHTETGNIWTHLLGFLGFIIIATLFFARPSAEVDWHEKIVFSAFFLGAISCLGFSWMFHTLYCHSEEVGRLFSNAQALRENGLAGIIIIIGLTSIFVQDYQGYGWLLPNSIRLDYCGISLLIMGSFVPWLYYSFYCRYSLKITYLFIVCTLGIACIVVSMWDGFAKPKYRTLRAGVFVALGLTGLFPIAHHIISDGFYHAVDFAALDYLAIVGSLYLSGAIIYAARFPECIWPGRFDIWFQSHQIFHVCVVIAAFLHYYGMSNVANNRLTCDGYSTLKQQ